MQFFLRGSRTPQLNVYSRSLWGVSTINANFFAVYPKVMCMDNERTSVGGDEVLNQIARLIKKDFRQRSRQVTVELVDGSSTPVDSPSRLLVRSCLGVRVAMALVSPPAIPGLVQRGMLRARLARAALGPRLGEVVLDPLAEGEIGGRSYSVLPYQEPLARSRVPWLWQRRQVAAALVGWLRDATAATVRERLSGRFEAPIATLASISGAPSPIRRAADQALTRMEKGDWTPQHVIMHGDLWKGNVLLDRAWRSRLGAAAGRPRRFFLIDWPGSLVEGYGIFDLIRLSRNFRVPRDRLASEIAHHCHLLKCGWPDAVGHLLAALGSIGSNLELFPKSRYLELMRNCVGALAQAGDFRPYRLGTG